MLNRPRSDLHEDRPGEAAWDTDRRPAARLVGLFVLVALPLVVAGARLGQIQLRLADQFAEPFRRTNESVEPIPTRDGRILGADGRVIAEDVRRFTLTAHYRWLEDPPDERWLREQALKRLDRPARRDSTLVEQAEREVLAERAAMWRRLAGLTGTSRDQLAKARGEVQRRVERIIASVNARHAATEKSQGPAITVPPLPTDAPWWRRAWEEVRSELTSAPPRDEGGPIIVQEELAYHPLLDDIDLHAAAEIEAHPQRFPGLQVQTATTRVYRQGRLAAHVVGVRTAIRGEEIRARQERFPDGDPLDYREGDRIGRGGLEQSYDRALRGLRGERRVVRNRQGEIVRTETVRRPQPGRDVVLTLNLPLQDRLEQLTAELLRQRATEGTNLVDGSASAGIAVVALDVRSGAVLASVSAPGYDIHDLIHPDVATWKELTSDPRRPFFNRVTQMAVPPGSVFKTLSAVAILENGRIDPDEPYYCRGYLDRPDRHRCFIFRHYGVGHQHTTLSDALAQSCNVYFYHAARVMGPEPLIGWAERFGFGRATGADLPGERGGHLPRPPIPPGAGIVPVSHRDSEGESEIEKWYAGDTLGLAIGQSRLTVTPLQVARLMAAVANDGHLVTPHYVRQVGTGTDADREPAPLPRRIPGLTTETLQRVREGLERVVAHPSGTGYKTVRLESVAIAGKTGTAEVGGGKEDHAWFAGYVPADRPRVAFAVIVEHAGSGGREAGPLAREVVEAMLAANVIPPDRRE
jgi:penicillin-binding protein 2